MKRAWRGLALSALCLAWTSAAGAGVTPTTKIKTGVLLDPAKFANSTYPLGHTSYQYGEPKEIVELARALSYGRTPDKTVEQVYDYVHNNIEIAWMFGLQKGAVGAIVDHSGTAFDQANLMVEVLRQAGISASYVFGTITLSGADFQAWSGITNAAAACQLLANGGIPASINNAVIGNCAYGSASISTITLTHVWVAATISGTTYAFDPAFKRHTLLAQDTGLAAQIAAGGAIAQATAGMSSGTVAAVGSPGQPGYTGAANYVQTLNGGALASTLAGYAGGVQTLISNNHPNDAIEDVIGGARIIPAYTTTLQGVSSTLSYGTPYAGSWATAGAEIPDSFRTSLGVQVVRTIAGTDTTIIPTQTLYVDEIYGRKLELIARDQIQLTGSADQGHDVLRLVDEFGGYNTIYGYPAPGGATDTPNYNFATLTLTINHPYPADGGAALGPGSYMDDVISKRVNMWFPLVIVNGWGDVGRGFVEKWGARDDSEAVGAVAADVGGCQGGTYDLCNPYPPSAGDGRREQLAAAWLTQSSRAARIHAAIAGAHYTHHHSVGVVSADTEIHTVDQIPGNNNSAVSLASDSFDRVDVDTAFSLSSDTADALKRRAAVHAIAETLEILEGSVAGQVADLPDTASVAARFDWGNAPPPLEDNPTGTHFGPRKVYGFASANGAAQPDITRFEGQLAASGSGTHRDCNDDDPIGAPQCEPNISSFESGAWRTSLLTAIQDYAAGGFEVVASEESFLGPGQRAGSMEFQNTNQYTHRPTHQRGGALIATQYDANGDPVAIAHVTVANDPDGHGSLNRYKGGGGGAQAGHAQQYDPSKAADVLKARFVDRSKAVGVELLAGNVTYTAPASLEVGQGEFPDKLSAQVFWRGGEVKAVFQPPGVTEPQTPWSTNWNNTLTVSGSGMEAMGLTDVRATGGTIAAFMAMQDVYRSAPSPQREATAELVGAWWARQLVHNVVTVNVGADTQQFVRRADNTWFAPGPGRFATLAISLPVGVADLASLPKYTHTCAPAYGQTRGWRYTGVSFTITNANGDVQTFPYWEEHVTDGGFCSDYHGFRLTTWTFPKGVTVNLTYQAAVNAVPMLTQVSNSLGRTLTFGYNAGGTLSSVSDGQRTISFGVDGQGRATFTDPVGNVTAVQSQAVGGWTGTQGIRPGARYQLTQVFAADDMGTPALKYAYDSLSRVSQAQDKLGVQGTRNPHTFLIGHGLHGERIDPTGGRYAVDYDENRHAVRFVDENGNVTSAQYDGRGRVKTYIYPELDREQLSYDDRNNQTALIKLPKPGSTEANAGQQLAITATWDVTWNKIAQLTDAKLTCTSTFTYYGGTYGNGSGELQQASRCGQANYNFQYNAAGQLTQTIDPTGVVTATTYDGNNYLYTTTLDPTGVAAKTTITNDPFGDPTFIDGPRPLTDANDVSQIIYDNNRRKVYEIQPPNASGNAATKYTHYDAVGRVDFTQQGYETSGGFQPAVTTSYAFDAVGNKIRETTPAGITQFSYDGMNRLVCTAERMSTIGLPGDACLPGPQTAGFGPDHIIKNIYDQAGQLTKVTLGLTSDAQTDFETYEYTPNGQRQFIIDGVCNATKLTYDGFDRLQAQYFPVPARGAACPPGPGAQPGHPGAWNTADHEDYGYDANGNRTSLRKRDGSLLSFEFDVFNQQIHKVVPSAAAQGMSTDTWFGFDLAGRPTYARYDTPGGKGITYGFDSARRVTSETSYSWTVSWTLDQAGNRTSLTWPDGFQVQYQYDAANRMARILEPGASSGPALLLTFNYDDLGRRTGLVRGNTGHADYSYDPAGRLQSLTQAGAPTAPASVQTISYTPASQIYQLTQQSPYFVWQGQPNSTTPYTYNGLNQDAAIAAVNTGTSGYDANGNLTNTGIRAYLYNADNRMAFTGDSVHSLGIAYDPLGRIRATHDNTNAYDYFLYVGDELIGEYADKTAAQPPLQRYVYGDGVDEPLVQYNYVGVSGGQGQRRWLHADRQGSIIAWSDDSGAAGGMWTYGPYGEPSSWTGSRFMYTGQVALPDFQAYFYKARIYDPQMGRFLQTDPVGQADDPNMYAYVRDDPENRTDSSGLCPVTVDGVPCAAVYAPGVHVSSPLLRFALDQIAAEEDLSLYVYSGDRTKAQNDAAHGAKNSSHLLGQAADVIFQGRTKQETLSRLYYNSARKFYGVRLLYHKPGSTHPEHTHLDLHKGVDIQEQTKEEVRATHSKAYVPLQAPPRIPPPNAPPARPQPSAGSSGGGCPTNIQPGLTCSAGGGVDVQP